MRHPSSIIDELEQNRLVFDALLRQVPEGQVRWKPAPDKWSLLEVVCHLHDVETMGGRVRVRHALETPDQPLPPMDPIAWVSDNKYMEQHFITVLDKLLTERVCSVAWMKSLQSPDWDSAHHHPQFGRMSARLFLHNMLAHDYFHLRQITRLKYGYLKQFGGQPLDYAGPWGEPG